MGLSPAISIEPKVTSGNPRSTVGTITEIYDFMRLLYARVGILHCYSCGRSVEKQSSEQIIDTIFESYQDNKIQIFAPVVRGRKRHYRELFEEILRDGFIRVRVNGDILFSCELSCHHCVISYQELAPNSFSFNSPYCSCKECEGLGEKKTLDVDLVIPDWNKTINDGGIEALGKPRNIWFFNQLEGVAEHLRDYK